MRPPPSLVQWLVAGANGGAPSWQGPAFWGVDNVRTAANTNGFYGGPLPAPGEWVRLSVPAILVGLEGQTVQGIAFATYDGAAAWDRAGKLPASPGAAGSGGAPEVVGTPLVQGCATAPPGLVASWKGQGTSSDSAGTNNGTAWYLTTPYPTGEVGNAFGLNGNDANVNVPDAPALRFTNAMSVETWIMPTLSGARAILSKWDIATGPNQRWYNLYINANGYANFTVSSDGTAGAGSCGLVTSAIMVTNGVWTHVAATYDGGVLSIYLNGSLQSPTTFWSAGIHAGPDDVGIGGVVGGASNGAVGAPFGGEIDEASLYSSVLTAAQVQSIYQAGSAGKCPLAPCAPVPPSLVAWWKGEGNALDSAGNNNGTNYYATYAGGEVGQAFSFNAYDGNINVPDAPALRFTNPMTVETWIMPTVSGARAILSKWDIATGPNQRAYNLYLDANGYANFTVSSDGTAGNSIIVSNTSPVPLNTWTHLAATFNEPSLSLYVNGQLAGSNTWYHTIYAGNDAVGIGGVVGGATGGAVGAPFGGEVDEASLYSSALMPAQIQAIYAAGTAGKCGPVSVAMVNDPTQDSGDTDPTHDVNKNTESECCFILANNSQTIVAAFSNTHLDEAGFGSKNLGEIFPGIPAPRSTYWSLSTNGGTWFTNTLPLPPSPTNMTSAWQGDAPNPVICYDPGAGASGTIYLLCNCSREPANWYGFRLWTSTNLGANFTLVNTNIPGDSWGISNVDRPMINVNLTNHDLYVAGVATFTNGGLFAASSANGGTSWTNCKLFDPNGHMPDIAVTPAGAVYVTWVTSTNTNGGYSNSVSYAWLPAGSTSWSGPASLGITLNSTEYWGERSPLRFKGDSASDSFQTLPFPRAVFANGYIYLVYSDLPYRGSTTDQGDIFLAEAEINGSDGSLILTTNVTVNNDGTQTDQWCPAIAVKPGGTELFVGYYSRQNDPVNNSWIRAYGAKGDVANGLANATFDCFPISPTAFQPLFAGTNSVASMQYDPVYPTGGYACWDDYARIVCPAPGRPPSCQGCITTIIGNFGDENWVQDDNTWAAADNKYFYYAWCDNSATWTTDILGTTNTTTRPDANVMLARIPQ